MPTLDHSQSLEQETILAWASTWTPGRFLDLGAGNGITYSNTRALFFADWAGVCVEPAPSLFDKLSRLYSSSKVECVNAAITAEREGLAPFHYVRDDHLSSLEAGWSAKWKVKSERIHVMTCPLAHLLHYFGDFEFVSIDVEGSSLELLYEYQEHSAWEAVQCLCVESEDGGQRTQIQEALPNWRVLALTPNNVVLAR